MATYSWGSSIDGQLGIGNYGGQTRQEVAKEVTTLSVSGPEHRCGKHHTGLSWRMGRCICGANNNKVQVSALETVVIKQVACGDDHTLAVSDRGQVLGWGRNDRGQCGLATGDVENKPRPRILKHLASYQFVKVCCGSLHSMALTRDGRLFAWGDNNTYGQLGIGSLVTNYTDRPTQLTSLRGVPFGAVRWWLSFLCSNRSGSVLAGEE
nr:probable E3 ubiquitin-protein ligase HERC4 [Lytechinus pictus]